MALSECERERKLQIAVGCASSSKSLLRPFPCRQRRQRGRTRLEAVVGAKRILDTLAALSALRLNPQAVDILTPKRVGAKRLSQNYEQSQDTGTATAPGVRPSFVLERNPSTLTAAAE